MKAVDVGEPKTPGPMLLLAPSVISFGLGAWVLSGLIFGAKSKPDPNEILPEVGRLFGLIFIGLAGAALLCGLTGLVFAVRIWLRQRGERH